MWEGGGVSAATLKSMTKVLNKISPTCFGVCAVLHDVFMNHFHDRHNTLRLAGLSSISTCNLLLSSAHIAHAVRAHVD